MEVTLGHTHSTVELRISTVALSHTTDNLVMLFRCTNCGTAISQYQGAVVKIYPIVEPSSSVLVISRCPECGSLYTFQTQEHNLSVPTKVILYGSETQKNYRCYVCRLPLIRFTVDHVLDLINKKEVFLPYGLKCPTQGCSGNYYFSEMV